MTTIQSLRSINAYPFPPATLSDIAGGCGLQVDAELDAEARTTAEFKRAKARVYIYLITAPNVSQNGISFSFTSEDRKCFKKMAKDLLAEIGDDPAAFGLGVKYGYMGEDL